MEKRHNGMKYNKNYWLPVIPKIVCKAQVAITMFRFFGYLSAHPHTFQVLASSFLELMKHAFAEYVRNKEAPISLSHSVRVSVSRSVHVYTVYNVHYMQCMFEQLHQMPVRLYLMVEKEAIRFIVYSDWNWCN